MEELINPALSDLKFLVGKWDIELSNASFLPDPTQKVNGDVSFDVREDGALLVMRQAGAAIWVIGRDEGQSQYVVLYYDDRNVSRVYKMSFDGKIWKMWRESQGFNQRFEGTVSDDKKTINAYWEKSTDGISWEHDFDMLYTKL